MITWRKCMAFFVVIVSLSLIEIYNEVLTCTALNTVDLLQNVALFCFTSLIPFSKVAMRENPVNKRHIQGPNSRK